MNLRALCDSAVVIKFDKALCINFFIFPARLINGETIL